MSNALVLSFFCTCSSDYPKTDLVGSVSETFALLLHVRTALSLLSSQRFIGKSPGDLGAQRVYDRNAPWFLAILVNRLRLADWRTQKIYRL